MLIARPESENSILEAVYAFSRRPRGMKLVMLGKDDPSQAYHKRVLDAASDEVVFAGAIYGAAWCAAGVYAEQLQDIEIMML